MTRRQPTVELDETLIDAARAIALRAGVPESELYERALREILARDFAALMDDVAQYQAASGTALSEDAASALATEEVRAVRASRRPGA